MFDKTKSDQVSEAFYLVAVNSHSIEGKKIKKKEEFGQLLQRANNDLQFFVVAYLWQALPFFYKHV